MFGYWSEKLKSAQFTKPVPYDVSAARLGAPIDWSNLQAHSYGTDAVTESERRLR
jgi:hypothetical protein